jgi:hypothetical protein
MGAPDGTQVFFAAATIREKGFVMIYSASRRTDLPVFYPEVIVDRVRHARKLEALALWTKDVGNLVRHPDLASAVRRVPTMVQYTVTGLAGSAWEPGVRPLEAQLPDVAALAGLLPRGAILWRFDPIIAAPGWRERFLSVKQDLDAALGGVGQVTVSFPDPYRKAVERVARASLEWRPLSLRERREAVAFLVSAFPGRREGEAVVRLCCEPELLDLPGVGMAHCIDGEAFSRLYGAELEGLAGLEKDGGQRKPCGCVQSTEIGSYEFRCGHGCAYCYANASQE